MPCIPFKTSTGSGFVCTRHKKISCGEKGCKRPATKLCDYVLENGRTCDANICGVHAKSVGPDSDYCPAHARSL